MTLRGILQVAAAIGAAASLWWVVDAIGDRREAKVHARYAKAAEATNLDLQTYNTEDEKIAAVAQALRDKALADAAKVRAPGCPATQEQADALNAIK